MTAILSTRHLTTGYRQGHNETVVTDDINVDMHAGKVTCLLGANGAGKSTLLRTLASQQSPLSGSVIIAGHDLDRMSRTELARLISVVHTSDTNAGALTVEEVTALGRQPYTGFFGRLSAEDRDIVNESIEAVGIAALSSRYMATLSDGERQKVMIARALAQRTPVMMLDEPTSFLDVASRLDVMRLLSRLAKEFSTAILLSTHDVGQALSISDDLWLMRKGAPLASGTKSRIIASGEMDNLFPGRNVRFDPAAMDFR